tara:strand:- start:4381 stop:5544 length:1164 start_codon:yes stop_codon:yes gene_type:complete
VSKKGIAYLNDRNSRDDEFIDKLEEINMKVISSRVTDIVMNETHPNFNRYGGWSSIGVINFENSHTPEKGSVKKPIAKPLYPQFKNYPLVNEIVLLFLLPDNGMNEHDNSHSYYYLNAINIWNHPHANPFKSQFRQDLDLNGVNPTGGEFIEKENIHPILSFKGDNIFEGRFGNSIRLGNTAKSEGLYKNTWSDKGENGSPITIIRNGQPLDSGDEGWEPIIEDINKDLASIYITSNQLIPIKAASTNYTGLENPPTHPSSYMGSQTIINADRVLLNAKEDNILLSSKKAISLSSNEGIGLATSGSISVEAGEVKLGSSVAEQPVILGETFLNELDGILGGLKSVVDALKSEPSLVLTPAAATILSKSIELYSQKVNTFKSKTVKVL